MKEFVRSILIELNIIKAERQPELENELREAHVRLVKLKAIAWQPWYDGRKRQNVLSKAVSKQWKAQRKLLAAGYKQKDINEILESMEVK